MKKFSNKSEGPSCAEVNAKDMVEYLASIGFQPTRTSHPNYWYLSPLRDEKTASFKVNRNKNTWFDFGIQQGGSLIDFCVRYYACSVREVLQKFQGIVTALTNVPQENISRQAAEPSIIIEKIRALQSFPLLNYLRGRRIHEAVAQKYCSEAIYKVGEKEYYAISFANDAGGYELRSRYFKGSSKPKAPTYISNGAAMLCVFEGFFDFLSFQTIALSFSTPPVDFLILNGVAFMEQCRPMIESHTSVLLYLDYGTGGNRATSLALSWNKACQDQRPLFEGYKDLNEWHCQIGKGGPGKDSLTSWMVNNPTPGRG